MRRRLRVIDHKTGADRTQPSLLVGGGEVLQPVLYALAVEAALERPVRDARLSFCTSRGGFTERVVPFDARSRTTALEVLATIDAAIVAGRFHTAPRKDACKYCDFRPVRPWEEERVLRKGPMLRSWRRYEAARVRERFVVCGGCSRGTCGKRVGANVESARRLLWATAFAITQIVGGATGGTNVE
jgi:hypothetical protein